MIRVKNYEEALATANNTEFGLYCGVCAPIRFQSRSTSRVRGGGDGDDQRTDRWRGLHVPFGGSKASSYGPREQGSYAREFYTWVKTVYVAYPCASFNTELRTARLQ